MPSDIGEPVLRKYEYSSNVILLVLGTFIFMCRIHLTDLQPIIVILKKCMIKINKVIRSRGTHQGQRSYKQRGVGVSANVTSNDLTSECSSPTENLIPLLFMQYISMICGKDDLEPVRLYVVFGETDE